MTNRADADIFAKTLLSDADMQRIASCAAPLPAAAAARIAELESQLVAEVERLDFVLSKYAYCAKFLGCMNTSGQVGDGYQLIVADEEDDCIAISGEDVNHPTPRAAIDAAIEFSKGGK